MKIERIPQVGEPDFVGRAQKLGSGRTSGLERLRELALASVLHHYAEEGFLVFDPLVEDLDALADDVRANVRPTVRASGPENYRSGERVQDAWKTSEAVRRIATAPGVLEFLRRLYGAEPFAFQTLNFRTGSEQATHTDRIHFDSEPAGWMCGVWVALEDVHVDAGPLHYYPGSHRIPFHDLRDALGINGAYTKVDESYPRYEAFVASHVRHREGRQLALLKKGQALVWEANLLHGGEPIRDRSLTRLSQVTHYFFKGRGCRWWTPLLSDKKTGRVMYRQPVDVATGEPVT